MGEHPDEMAPATLATLVRRAGEPLPPDLRRRIRSTIEGQLAGDLIVDTFDDVRSVHAEAPVRARRRRWVLAAAAAVTVAAGIGWVVAVSDRAEAPRTTSPESGPPTTAEGTVRTRTVSMISTASPTGERSVGRLMVLDEHPDDVVSSEFLPDGRLLRWSSTEDGEVVRLYSRWGGVEVSTVLPKGTAVAGAGERMMRDVAVGPDDVLYTSYLTSVTPGGWHFDLVAYSFEQQPRELGRWPGYRTCTGDPTAIPTITTGSRSPAVSASNFARHDCGDVVLADEGVVIDDDGRYVEYVDAVTGLPSGKRQYYVLDPVRASYERTRKQGRSGLDATISYGEETWTLVIDGIMPEVGAEEPLELQPQRDGSLLGVVFGQEGDEHLNYVLWLRPGGDAELYGLEGSVVPQVMYSVLGSDSILAVGWAAERRQDVMMRL